MDIKAWTPEHGAIKSSSSKALPSAFIVHPMLSLSLSLSPPQFSRPLYFSAFLSSFDNIKRSLVAARAFIKSVPERGKKLGERSRVPPFALSASQISRVSREIVLPTDRPIDRSLGKRLARKRRIDAAAAIGTPIFVPTFFFFCSGIDEYRWAQLARASIKRSRAS